jgi:hypothetical protein
MRLEVERPSWSKLVLIIERLPEWMAAEIAPIPVPQRPVRAARGGRSVPRLG